MGWRSRSETKPRTLAKTTGTPAAFAAIAAQLHEALVSQQTQQLQQGPSPNPRHVEGFGDAPKRPRPSWRWLGDCWWEDPATGHLHWCEV